MCGRRLYEGRFIGADLGQGPRGVLRSAGSRNMAIAILLRLLPLTVLREQRVGPLQQLCINESIEEIYRLKPLGGLSPPEN